MKTDSVHTLQFKQPDLYKFTGQYPSSKTSLSIYKKTARKHLPQTSSRLLVGSLTGSVPRAQRLSQPRYCTQELELAELGENATAIVTTKASRMIRYIQATYPSSVILKDHYKVSALDQWPDFFTYVYGSGRQEPYRRVEAIDDRPVYILSSKARLYLDPVVARYDRHRRMLVNIDFLSESAQQKLTLVPFNEVIQRKLLTARTSQSKTMPMRLSRHVASRHSSKQSNRLMNTIGSAPAFQLRTLSRQSLNTSPLKDRAASRGNLQIVSLLEPQVPIKASQPQPVTTLECVALAEVHQRIGQSGILVAKQVCDYFGQPWSAVQGFGLQPESTMLWEELLEFYSVIVLERAGYTATVRYIWNCLEVRSQKDLDNIISETKLIRQCNLPGHLLKSWVTVCETAAKMTSLEPEKVSEELADQVPLASLRSLIVKYFKLRRKRTLSNHLYQQG